MSNPMTDHKIVLIKRKTRLEELVVRYNTIQQAKFTIERLGADFSDYITEDQHYQTAVIQAISTLSTLGRIQVLEREHVPNFIFGEQDIVVVLGQDGLVANTLKYLTEQPLIGVNPDPLRWDGILLPFTVKDLPFIVPDVFHSRRPIKEVTLAKAQLNDGQYLYAVNDLFIGRKTHVSARYQLSLDDKIEQQSSSGVIISTGLGSTGWFKSVLAGATGIVRGAAREQMTNTPQDATMTAGTRVKEGHHNHLATSTLSFNWDSTCLYFMVREPFPSKTTATELVFGQIEANHPLKISSQMPEEGVIFSDGIEGDFLEFNAGIEATIGIADKKGHLIV
ncbi:sugar kinase [Paenibacillus sp. DS2015]|uniref:sugar kinase n=1 Tax=Paenibacillus sp. DS2015 TaxID=3373917 RepID=UPI003D231FBC